MSPRNGRNRPHRSRIELAPGSASSEEAAALAAAIEGFLRDTAPAPTPATGPSLSPWTRAARFEAAGFAGDAPSPWGDPDAWGR